MKLVLVALLTTFIGCQTYNSNTFDEANYGASDLIGDANFKASYPILQKHCMSCHDHKQWAGYKNQEDWVKNESLVFPGDASKSKLIFRIINYGGTSNNMPQGGSKLPKAEYDQLVKWVEEFTP